MIRNVYETARALLVGLVIKSTSDQAAGSIVRVRIHGNLIAEILKIIVISSHRFYVEINLRALNSLRIELNLNLISNRKKNCVFS